MAAHLRMPSRTPTNQILSIPGIRGIYDLNGKGEVRANFGYPKVTTRG